jgi:D-alanine-D-alanine ligase
MAIATDKVKHDPDYQEKRGIFQQMADIPDAMAGRIAATSRRIFKLLYLDGYARIDYRLDKNGDLYFLEANPNPEIAPGEVFAEAADAVGYTYPALLQKILNLGLRRGR